MEPIEIEARGFDPEVIIDKMINHLYLAGFHTAGRVTFGNFEAFVVERESDGLRSILLRFLGKLDFILLGATEDMYKAIDNILSERNLTIRRLNVAGKSPQQVMDNFVSCLTEIKKDDGKPVSKYIVSYKEVIDEPSQEVVFAMEVAGVLRMILDDADKAFMEKLVS